MFEYGKIFACYPNAHNRGWFRFLSKIYLALFGYPDIGGHIQFPLVLRLLSPKKGEKILDAGCGNGIYINTIAQEFGVKGWGVDINEKYLEKAKILAKNLNLPVEFKKMSLTNLRFPDNFFDKTICLQVLQFIGNDEKGISEIARVLKKEGILVLGFPGEKYYYKNSKYKIANSKNDRIETMKVKRSGYSFNKMEELLNKAGFRVLEAKIVTGPLFKKLAFVQNCLHLKKLDFLNLALFPLLLLLAKIDASLRKAKPEEAVYLLKAKKV